jgi:hypothetical protein
LFFFNQYNCQGFLVLQIGKRIYKHKIVGKAGILLISRKAADICGQRVLLLLRYDGWNKFIYVTQRGSKAKLHRHVGGLADL